LNTGGYDEVKFEGGWSSEDKDFNLRLRNHEYRDIEIASFYLDAVRHNDRMRFREYPHMADIAGDLLINTHTVTKTTVNDGNVGCGIVYRNFDWDVPITIEPLSNGITKQRIFGIGLHKTATTSLHIALQILGYSSWHWTPIADLPPAHAAQAIWREMNRFGQSRTLELSSALSDLPIPLLYKKLDAAYPGSKFVLTTRSERGWLEAAMRHFSPTFNKHRALWDHPFIDFIHNKLYGRVDFESETFIARYRRHNSEVLEYFEGRANDLLVMNMDDGAGWPELCAFLNCSIPTGTYPLANGARRE
jgi:hypothetical protein